MFNQRLRGSQLANQADGFQVQKAFENLFTSQPVTSPNLRIQGGSAAATWQSQNATLYIVDGVMFSLAAQSSQAVPSALTWTAVASTFQAGGFIITVDAQGTVRTIPTNVGTGTSAALALQAVRWPVIPPGQVAIGGAVIANTAANVAFTAGTTNLDAANISTTFFNLLDSLYPISSM